MSSALLAHEEQFITDCLRRHLGIPSDNPISPSLLIFSHENFNDIVNDIENYLNIVITEHQLESLHSVKDLFDAVRKQLKPHLSFYSIKFPSGLMYQEGSIEELVSTITYSYHDSADLEFLEKLQVENPSDWILKLCPSISQTLLNI